MGPCRCNTLTGDFSDTLLGDFIVPLTLETINGIVPYGVYLSDDVFAILRNVHIGPEQINLTSSVNVLFI